MLGRLPLLPAFDRLPMVVSRTYGRYLDRAYPNRSTTALEVKQWQATAMVLGEAIGADGSLTFKTANDRLDLDAMQVEKLRAGLTYAGISTGTEADRQKSWRRAVVKIECTSKRAKSTNGSSSLAKCQFRMDMTTAAKACLTILKPSWRAIPMSAAFGEATPSTGGDAHPTRAEAISATVHQGVAGPVVNTVLIAPNHPATPKGGDDGGKAERFYRAAEDLVAMEIIARHEPLCHPPPEPRRLPVDRAPAPAAHGHVVPLPAAALPPMLFIWTLVLAVFASLVYVYVKMDRDEFLSRVSKTPPDKITFDESFFLKIIGYAVPLLGLVIAQFPDLSDILNSWLEPLTRVLR